jgi:hypothetical protein
MIERNDRTAVTVVRVLHAQQTRTRDVLVFGLDRSFECREIEAPAHDRECVRETTGVRRDPTLLVEIDVGLVAEHHSLARLGVAFHRDLVAHRAARHVDRGLHAGELGDTRLESLHRGIVAEYVVAELRLRHRAFHRRRRAGHRVAAEIDDRHGAKVYGTRGPRRERVTRLRPDRAVTRGRVVGPTLRAGSDEPADWQPGQRFPILPCHRPIERGRFASNTPLGRASLIVNGRPPDEDRGG